MSNPIRDAIILVAGTGSRLRPLTDTTHKALLEVGGRPLLFRLLQQLADQGIERSILATGYLDDQIRGAVDSLELDLEVTYAHNPDFDTTNNAESLRLALPELEDRPVLLCDGDILARDLDWMGPMLASPERNELAVLDHDDIAEEEMKVRLADGDEPVGDRPVEGLSKNISARRADAESIGIQTLSSPFVSSLSERLEAMSGPERADAYYEDMFAYLIPDAHAFYTRPIPAGSWTEIDTPEDLDRARQLAENWNREGG